MDSYLQFLRTGWPLLGFGFLTVFWGNFGQSFFIAWFGADIQRSLGLSAGQYGAAYSAATLLSAVTVVWAGGLIDRMSLGRFVGTTAIGLCVACAVLASAGGLVMLMIGLYLLRLFGQSLLPHTGMTSMSRYFSEARGRAISVAMSGVPVGEMILPTVVVTTIAVAGWQGAFAVIGTATVVILMPALWWLLSRARPLLTHHHGGADSGGRREGADSADGGRRVVLADSRFWLALPALLTTPFMVTGIFIQQGFLIEAKGWTPAWLALCFTLYGLVHWISSLGSGALVDRFGATRMLPFLQVPMLMALLVAAFIPGWWAAPVMMVLLGMSAGAGPPVTGSLWPAIYGTARLGAIRSMNMALMVGATSVSPILFGHHIDRGVEVATLFGFCALYVLLALVLVCLSYPRDNTPRKENFAHA